MEGTALLNATDNSNPVLDDDGLRNLMRWPEDVDLEYYRRRGLPHIIFRRNGARMYRYLTASVLSWLADREHGREDRHAVDQAVSLDFNP